MVRNNSCSKLYVYGGDKSSCVCFIVMCLFGGGSALVNSVVFLLGCGCCGVDWGVACVYFFTVSL